MREENPGNLKRLLRRAVTLALPPVLRYMGRCCLVLSLLLIVCRAPGWSDPLQGSEVVILKSKELAPYNQIQAGFLGVLGGKGTVHCLDDRNTDDQKIISNILARNPRLVLAIGSPAARIAAQAQMQVPVVLSMILSPGIAGDIKGPVASCIALPTPEDLFRDLKRILPGINRIGTVYDPRHTTFLVAEGAKAAQALNLELTALEVSSLGDAIRGLDQLATRVDALWMLPDRTVLGRQSLEHMLLISFRNHIPLLAISEKYVRQGAFMTLKVDYTEIGKQSAHVAHKLINGTLPQGQDAVFARNNVLVINLKTAERLGIDVPAHIREEAVLVNK